MDMRLENPSNLPFIVRQVEVTLEKKDGGMAEGLVVSKGDHKQLFDSTSSSATNTTTRSRSDQVPPHGTVDRMVAARSRSRIKTWKAPRRFIRGIEGSGWSAI